MQQGCSEACSDIPTAGTLNLCESDELEAYLDDFIKTLDEGFCSSDKSPSGSSDTVSDTSSLSDVTCGGMDSSNSDMESFESSGEDTFETLVGNESKKWGQKYQDRSGRPVV